MTNIVHVISFETRIPYTDARGGHRMRWGSGLSAYADMDEANRIADHYNHDKDYRRVKVTALVVNEKRKDGTAPGMGLDAAAGGVLWPRGT